MTLEELANEGEQLDATFIVGAQRSGTSILYRSLLEQPAFTCMEPEHRGDLLRESKIFHHLPNLHRFSIGTPVDLYNFMFRRDDLYEQFLDATRSAASDFESVEGPRTPMPGGDLHFPWHQAPTIAVLRAYYALAYRARRPDILVEKSPHNVHFISQLQEAFPRAQFVYVHRHPVDVYSSFIKRARTSAARWADLSVGEFSEVYDSQARLALRWSNRIHQKFHLISYSDFVSNPVDVVAGILRYHGRSVRSDRVGNADEDGIRNFHQDPHLFGRIVPETKRWDEWISAEDVARLESALCSIMDLLGYDSLTQSSLDRGIRPSGFSRASRNTGGEAGSGATAQSGDPAVEIADLKQRLLSAEAKLDEVYGSTSWRLGHALVRPLGRLTKSLRTIGR